MNVSAIFHTQTLGMFAREVIASAELRGFKAHRLGLGRERSGSLLVLTKRPRVIWAVLRAQRLAVTAEQLALLTELSDAGQEAYVWRPSTMPQMRAILDRET